MPRIPDCDRRLYPQLGKGIVESAHHGLGKLAAWSAAGHKKYDQIGTFFVSQIRSNYGFGDLLLIAFSRSLSCDRLLHPHLAAKANPQSLSHWSGGVVSLVVYFDSVTGVSNPIKLRVLGCYTS